MLVLGAFRSGTNATKACLENFFKVDVVFNRWFWKHGLPPACVNHPLPQHVSVLLLCRHPFSWSMAMHRFWLQRRPELKVAESFSDFLRQPISIYDNTGPLRRPHFWFSNPIDYWNRYYYSWLSWGDLSAQMDVVRCEDLLADAHATLAPLAQKAGWRRRQSGSLQLPIERVGPPVTPAEADVITTLCDEDRAFIAGEIASQIFNDLGYHSLWNP